MPSSNYPPKKDKDKTSGEKKAQKQQIADAETSEKAEGKKKPTKFVKCVKGTQFQDPRSGVYYLRDQLTPVDEITDWARKQAAAGLLEIIE